MENKKISISIVTILIVLVIVNVLVLTIRKLNEPISIDSSNFRTLPVNKYYLEAKRIASEWKKDSYFAYVSPSFAMSYDSGTTLLITYGFRDSSEPSRWINILFVDTNPVHVEISEGQDGIEPVSTKAIDINSLKIDSIDAIKIAYENGGINFIQRYGEINSDSFAQLGIENRTLGAGELMWRVTFSASRYNVMYVTINSATGEVIESWQSND